MLLCHYCDINRHLFEYGHYALCLKVVCMLTKYLSVFLVDVFWSELLCSVCHYGDKLYKQGAPEWRIMQGFMWDQARYGFCKSSKVGDEEPEVECEIYEAQNITYPMKHPAQSRRDCTPPRHRPGHQGHGHKDKTPDQRGRPEHAGHDHKDKKHDHRGRPEHPHLCPKGPSGVPESAPEGSHEFPCHGFVKIPPSIYPICPFPPPRLCRGPPDFERPRPPPPPQ